jgi:hypothetical protein
VGQGTLLRQTQFEAIASLLPMGLWWRRSPTTLRPPRKGPPDSGPFFLGCVQYSRSLSIIELTTNADATTSPWRIDWLIE